MHWQDLDHSTARRARRRGSRRAIVDPRGSGSMRLLPALLVARRCCSRSRPARMPRLYKWVDEKGVVHYTDKSAARGGQQGQHRAQQARRRGQEDRAGARRRPSSGASGGGGTAEAAGEDRERMSPSAAIARSSIPTRARARSTSPRRARWRPSKRQMQSAQAYIEQIAKRRGGAGGEAGDLLRPGRSRHRFGARARDASTPSSRGRPNSSSASRRKRRRSTPATTPTSSAGTSLKSSEAR